MKPYVLNLDYCSERWVKFQKLNSHVKNIYRVSAVDGKDVYRFSQQVRQLIDPQLQYSVGALGCALSHIRQWQECAEKKFPRMIVEDDALIHHDFDHYENFLLELHEDYDIIVWGYNWDCPIQVKLLPDIFSTQITLNQKELAIKGAEIYQRALIPHPSLYQLEYCFGTPAYTISSKGARKLIQKLLPLQKFKLRTRVGEVENVGIDVALNTVFHDLKAYACYPPLVITPNDKTKSTITGV